MKNLLATALFLPAFLAATTKVADADSRVSTPRFRANGIRRSTTNPYLDLLSGNRGGRSLTQQYFRNVRPELEFRQFNGRYRQDLYRLQRRLDQQQRGRSKRPDVLPTGHSSRFLTHGKFYRFRSPTYRR